MTKEDTLASLFVNIERIKDEILATDEIVPEKELVNNSLLGLTPTWDSFGAKFNSWKVAPTFEEQWISDSQEELIISLASNPEGVPNAYISEHK